MNNWWINCKKHRETDFSFKENEEEWYGYEPPYGYIESFTYNHKNIVVDNVNKKQVEITDLKKFRILREKYKLLGVYVSNPKKIRQIILKGMLNPKHTYMQKRINKIFDDFIDK
jgi:hypothetical protein